MTAQIYRTRQQIFDIAYKGLASQDFQRSVFGQSCRYRGANGMKCAIGHLISDEDYRFDLEGLGTGNSHVRHAAKFSASDIKFARTLQNIHDCSTNVLVYTPDTIKQNMEAFAEANGLTIPELT